MTCMLFHPNRYKKIDRKAGVILVTFLHLPETKSNQQRISKKACVGGPMGT